MAIWTYVRNQEPNSKLVAVNLEGGLILRIGTYANLSSGQYEEIKRSGVPIVLEEGIVPPSSPAERISSGEKVSYVFKWEPNTFYFENQILAHEGEMLRTLRNFISGESYVF